MVLTYQQYNIFYYLNHYNILTTLETSLNLKEMFFNSLDAYKFRNFESTYHQSGPHSIPHHPVIHPSNPEHPVSLACFLDLGYARQCSGFKSWIRQTYLSWFGSFLSQGHLWTSSPVTGLIHMSYTKWVPSWMGETHSKISSLPSFCHIAISSSVAHVEHAS